MYKIIASILLLASLNVSAATEEQVVSAKEQVAGITKMCADNGKAMEERRKEKSFYIRLGKREGIAKFSKSLYEAHKVNPKIGHMFKNVPEQPFLNNVIEMIVVGSGGEGDYVGRDMVTAHKHLGVSNQDFLDAGSDVQKVMKNLGYGENEVQEMVCMLAAQIPQVVVTE